MFFHALQNLLADNEAACTLAMKAGAIRGLKGILARWVDVQQCANPPELPSQGEDISEEEDKSRVGMGVGLDQIGHSLMTRWSGRRWRWRWGAV